MCTVPSQIPYLKVKIDGTDAVLSWPAVEYVKHYKMQTRTDDGPWVNYPYPIKDNSYVMRGLKEGGKYAFRIKGVNNCGEGQNSPHVYRNVLAALPEGIKWSVPPRAEPGHYLRPIDDESYAVVSEKFNIDVSDGRIRHLYFGGNTDICGIVGVCKDVPTVIDEGDIVIVLLSDDSVVIGDCGTHLDEGEVIYHYGRKVELCKQAIPKLFSDSRGRQHELDETGSQGFAKAGFTTASVTDGISVETLRKLGFVDENGILSFMLTHVVCGTGHAYIDINYTGRTPRPICPTFAKIKATLAEGGCVVSWSAINYITTVYRRVVNGEWQRVAVMHPGASSYVDHGIVDGIMYCYRVGLSSLPEHQIAACVFGKSI